MSLYEQLVDALCTNINSNNILEILKDHFATENVQNSGTDYKELVVKNIFDQKYNQLYKYNEIMSDASIGHLLELDIIDKKMYKVYADTFNINLVEKNDNQYVVYHTHTQQDYKKYPYYIIYPFFTQIEEPSNHILFFEEKPIITNIFSDYNINSIIIDHISTDNEIINNNLDDFVNGETINNYNNQSSNMKKTDMINIIMQKTTKYKISHLRAKLKSEVQDILYGL